MIKRLVAMLKFVAMLPLMPILGIHTTVAFAEAPAVTAEENIAGVADQHARVTGDDIYIGKYNHIIGMFGGGWTCQTLRLVSPSLRRSISPWITPHFSSAADAHWAVHPILSPESPIPLDTNEALNALIDNAQVGATHYNWCGVLLSEGVIVPVHGDIRSVEIVISGTMTIGIWTNHTITFSQDLPVGRYQIVGAQCRSAYAGVFRFVPIGADHRPGGMVDGEDKNIDTREQRHGKLGVWCEFDQLTPPSLEICPYRASSWATLRLDLIKVS